MSLFLSLVCCAFIVQSIVGEKNVNSLELNVINLAGAPIELFWVNTFDPVESVVRQTKKPLRNTTSAMINSYVDHKFMVKFLKDIPGTEVNFTKSGFDEKVTVKYDEVNQRLTVEQSSHLKEVVKMIEEKSKDCKSLPTQEEIIKCVSNQILHEVNQIQQTSETLEYYRDIMAYRLRNYTCKDENIKTTEPEKTYIRSIGGKNYPINVLLDMDSAKIWTIDDFVTAKECEHLLNYARPRLQRATVSDDQDGSDVISETRRAQQASYEFDHTTYSPDPIWPLYNRIIQVTNTIGRTKVKSDGQEGFSIIQYLPGDEYIPHCDGACDGSPFIPGGRVATALLYCQAAEKGGATTFSKADIVIQPELFKAVFFSYKGLDNIMDEGYTEHSGCPVVEGEKWVITAWLREGVSKQKDWTHFDPLGVPLERGGISSQAEVNSEPSDQQEILEDDYEDEYEDVEISSTGEGK